MERLRQLLLLLRLLCIITLGAGLNIKDVEEGSCHAIRNVPTVHNFQPNQLDKMGYILGGNRYQLYRHVRGHPHFENIREFKFFYEACLYKNVSLAAGGGSMFGFGDQCLVTMDVRGRKQDDEHGVLFASRELPGPGIHSGHSFTSKVVLTDHHNWAVVVHCWEFPGGFSQKGWSVYSNDHILDRNTRKRVEKHVLSLGFERKNVVFLEYETCRHDLDYDNDDFKKDKHLDEHNLFDQKDKHIEKKADHKTNFHDSVHRHNHPSGTGHGHHFHESILKEVDKPQFHLHSDTHKQFAHILDDDFSGHKEHKNNHANSQKRRHKQSAHHLHYGWSEEDKDIDKHKSTNQQSGHGWRP